LVGRIGFDSPVERLRIKLANLRFMSVRIRDQEVIAVGVLNCLENSARKGLGFDFLRFRLERRLL
jgi:hypothetical protein